MSTALHPSPSASTSDDLVSAWARRFSPASTIALSVLGAVAVNVGVWAVGALAGASFEYTDAGSTMSAAPGGIIVLTAVPMVVGMAVAALVARRWAVVIRVAQVVGSVLALLTIAGTVSADFDGASTVALAVAHVVIVPFLVIGLEVIGRRRRP